MRRVQIGKVGVDSGQLMVCDPCYIDSEWGSDEFNYKTVCGKTNPDAQLNYKMGHPGVAVAFDFGYGDGVYPVYATINGEGRIIKVEIIMD